MVLSAAKACLMLYDFKQQFSNIWERYFENPLCNAGGNSSEYVTLSVTHVGGVFQQEME